MSARVCGSGTQVWTDDRIAELRRLNHLGLSAARIAAELGDVSRNAVIGKLLRLGLKLAGAVGPRKPRAPSTPAPRAQRNGGSVIAKLRAQQVRKEREIASAHERYAREERAHRAGAGIR